MYLPTQNHIRTDKTSHDVKQNWEKPTLVVLSSKATAKTFNAQESTPGSQTSLGPS